MEKKYDIFEFSNACWNDVFEKISGAAVYIDHAATECLHWFKGDRAYLEMIEAGAHSVHEMAMFNFQYVKVQGTTRAIIITTSSDPSFYQRTLKMIIEKNTFDSCTMICAVHSTILNYDEAESYEKLKENVLTWMKETNPVGEPFVEILFRPIFAAPINPNVFVIPAIRGLMPPIDGKITEEHDSNVNYFVSSLHSLFTHFNIKEDIYSLGKFSEYVAEKLENLPAAVDRRKMLIGQAGVTLILIDRTLDLCTATKNNTECILSRILHTLPHLPYHNNDVAVNMTLLCPDAEESSLSMTVPGCLATSEHADFSLLIEKNQKDVLLTFNKWLLEMTLNKLNSPKAKLSTRVTAHSLEKLIQKFCGSQDLREIVKYSKKLQIIMAVIQSLKSEKNSQLDLLVSLEKLILQNLMVSRGSTSVLSQISNIIKMRTTKGLDIENLLVLLIHIYAIAGTEIYFNPQQENQFKAALTEAIYEDIQKCNDTVINHEVSVYQQTLLLLGVMDESAARESAEKMTEQIMDMLHSIASQRQDLKDYGSMIGKSDRQETSECTSLIERLLNDLVHPSRPELTDLQRRTKSLISAGFNLLTKGRAQRHPTDNPWIIIYIMGGITAEEIQIVERISSRSSNIPQITLAGCRLLTPVDIVDRVLLSNLNM